MSDEQAWVEVGLIDGHVIYVDRQDQELAESVPWRMRRVGLTCYAAYGTRFLHRELTEAKKGQVIDHWNGDTFDNRRGNLRIADRSTNGQNRIRLSASNTSGCTGVSKDKQRGAWMAFIREGGRTRITSIDTKEEAIEVRRALEVLVYGDFAPLRTQAKGTLVGKFASMEELRAAYSVRKGGAACGGNPYRGVYRVGKRFLGRYKVKGRDYNLGSFSTAEEARDAVQAAKRARAK